MLLAISVNKACRSHQHYITLPPAQQWAPRESGRAKALQSLKQRILRPLRMRGHGILAQIAKAHTKEWFQWAPNLHLPIHRKAPNSLTWHLWFSLINNDLLMFWLFDFLLQNPPYILVSTPAPASLEQSLSVIWDAVSQAWSPQNVRWIKDNSQLLDYALFQSIYTQETARGKFILRN